MPKTYEPIQTQVLTGTQATLTFSSIPQTYTDLVVVCSSRASTSGTYDDEFGMRFNSDTGNNYSRTRLLGDGSSVGSLRGTNEDKMFGGFHPKSTDTASVFSPNIWHIFNYANTTTYKTVLVRGNNDRSNTGQVILSATLWRSTAAITSFNFTLGSGGSFAIGSTFTLYGIKAA